jgi:hypothetical protein
MLCRITTVTRGSTISDDFLTPKTFSSAAPQPSFMPYETLFVLNFTLKPYNPSLILLPLELIYYSFIPSFVPYVMLEMFQFLFTQNSLDSVSSSVLFHLFLSASFPPLP